MSESIEKYLMEINYELGKLKTKLELWEDGDLLHENHYKYQNDLEDMIRKLIYSDKNCINDILQNEAASLISQKKPRCSSTNK